MENLQNNFRDVIECAVLAGMISEDKKHEYLSGIREENDSELSEIEGLLNMDSKPQFKQENECVNTISLTDETKNTNKHTEDTSFNSGDSKSMVSGSTVENYSILDFNGQNCENDSSEDSTADTFTVSQQNGISVSTRKFKSASAFAKVVKKPIKDQIIDFNVPVYIGIKKKKSPVKPLAFNSTNKIQREISKTYRDINNISEIKDNEKLQSISKWTLPKTKISMLNKQAVSSTNAKDFADASSLINVYESPTEHAAQKYQIKDKFAERKLQSFSSEKQTLKHQEDDPTSISKYLQTELDKANRHGDCQTYTMKSRRRLKVRKDLMNTDQKQETKERYLVNSKVHKQLDTKKKKTKKKIYMASKTDKCKCCKCHYNCKSNDSKDLNETKAAESNSEDTISFHGISMKTHTCGKDHERVLNVNIIYQFYDDDDDKGMEDESTQESQVKKDTSEAQMEKTKTSEEHKSEIEKNKKKNKIQYLSRLLANMKIKKKPNQSNP